MLRRHYPLVFAASLLLPAAVGSVRAQSQVAVSISDSTQMAVVRGRTLRVPVIIIPSGGANIATFQGAFTYGTPQLRYDSLRAGPFGLNTFGFFPGTFTLGVSRASGQASRDTLASLWFTADTTRAGGLSFANVAGSRFTANVTTAGNAAGTNILGNVLARLLDVCVVRSPWGDTNDDGVVNILDAQQGARWTLGLIVGSDSAARLFGDVTGDGVNNIIDAQQIARYSVGLSAAARINTPAFIPPAVASVTLSPAGPQSVAIGARVQLTGDPRNSAGGSLGGCAPVTWSTSNASVATVGPTGLVLGVGTGSATITATSGGASATSSFSVVGGLQFSQQGPKLVAFDAVGNALQGSSVSLSADGSPAIVGGAASDSGAGAAWVWTRSGGVWSQQGSKLVGTGGFTNVLSNIPGQGRSVSIAADGNTAVVASGGGVGAIWVWKRSGSAWTQQGPRLIPGIPNCLSCAPLASAVSISADGSTVAVSGFYDDANPGVVSGGWIWTLSGGVWTQQGPMLVASDGVQPYGGGVALSADGSTAVFGGYADNNFIGAAWVWTRSGGVWSQQGPKLVGSGAVGGANGGSGTVLRGTSVSMSADGNTAIVGGPEDGCCPTANGGAVWVWSRSGGVWSQQGPKLKASSGASGQSQQGMAVSLSADGNTALIGGVSGNSQTSTSWVWTRTAGLWTQQGTSLVGSEVVGSGNGQFPGVSAPLSADGRTAIVGGYFDNAGAGAAWVFVAPPSSSVSASYMRKLNRSVDRRDPF